MTRQEMHEKYREVYAKMNEIVEQDMDVCLDKLIATVRIPDCEKYEEIPEDFDWETFKKDLEELE